MALYINNVLTTVKEGTKITIARENPYFTGRGDYSMNVVLPLVGCVNNRNAFGHGARGGGVLDRPEVNHKKLAGKKYPASIRANRLRLDGHAIITNCTETEVTVQLVMGISAVKHPLDDEDTKINKLNLGTAWDDWPELFYADGAGGQEAMNPKDGNYNDFRVLFHAFPVLKNGGVEAVERMMRGDYPDTKCVCLPIYSEGDEVIANPVRRTQMGNGTYNNTLAGRVYGEEDSDPNFTLMAPQPYLLDVIQRIFKAIGYPWENEEDWGNTTFARIILANARCAIRIEHLLPSWSVKEFLQEVEAFFSGVFVFRDNSVRLIPHHSLLDRNMIRHVPSNCINHRRVQFEKFMGERRSTIQTYRLWNTLIIISCECHPRCSLYGWDSALVVRILRSVSTIESNGQDVNIFCSFLFYFKIRIYSIVDDISELTPT